MKPEERQFISKLKQGDRDGFARLYELHGGRIYDLAYKMCGSREDAEDILQKTFLQAYSGIEGFREESGIGTWLYAIAKNLCLRLLDNRKRSRFSAFDELIHSSGNPDAANHYNAVEKQFLVTQVKEGCLLGLLRCLSLEQRFSFILNILLEVRVSEIAIILNKSENAVRVLIHRARHNIRQFLCKNCSLYEPGNKCRCENLIDFSLKKGWIQPPTDNDHKYDNTYSTLVMEKEIKEMKKILLLYKSLGGAKASEGIIKAIQKEIQRNGEKIIFKKV